MAIRVLIADPDHYLAESYRAYLQEHGCEVVTATSGLECMARLRDSAPDVLVLEPALPWGWGDGVLAVMREEPDLPRIPVIALTFGRDRGVLYGLASYPVDDYQLKPLPAKRLAQIIGAVVARHTAIGTGETRAVRPATV